MATSPAFKQLYPLSTRDGNAIPLDAASPLNLYKKTIAANIATQVNIPVDMKLVSIHATIAMVLDFLDTATYPLADEDLKAEALYLPADTILTIWLQAVGPVKAVPVNADEAGLLFIQGIQKWAAIGLEQNTVVR